MVQAAGGQESWELASLSWTSAAGVLPLKPAAHSVIVKVLAGALAGHPRYLPVNYRATLALLASGRFCGTLEGNDIAMSN